MASAQMTICVKDVHEVQRVIQAARAVTRAWDALCDYEADLFPCHPQLGKERQDALDTALAELKGLLAGDND